MRRLARIAIVLVPVLVLAAPPLVDVYTDWLWFGETGYQAVFLRSLTAQSTLGTAALVLALAWLLLNLRPAVEMATPRAFTIMTEQGPRSVAIGGRGFRRISYGLAILVSVLFDLGAQLNIWRVIAVAERRAQDVANTVLPGLGTLLAVLVSLGGLAFNIGRVPGSEYRWPPASAKWPLGSYTAILGYATTSVAKFDRFYDPNGDGVLSLDEIKAWDPNLSPPPVANDLRRFDNTGDLQHPIIIGHGSHDPIVSPGETVTK